MVKTYSYQTKYHIQKYMESEANLLLCQNNIRTVKILFTKPTCLTESTRVTWDARAAISIRSVIARGTVLTRLTATLIDVYIEKRYACIVDIKVPHGATVYAIVNDCLSA